MMTNARYREEILSQVFQYIRSGESFYIVGAPSVGKTRLINYLIGANFEGLDNTSAKKIYLDSQQVGKTWIVPVDMNRLLLQERGKEKWVLSFFELMIYSIFDACHEAQPMDSLENIQQQITSINAKVMESKDALQAFRLFEMATTMLCNSYGIKLCFVFDEFDEYYKLMPAEIFAHLRAIRDANKYQVIYMLFLRNLPENLRIPLDNESFFELISRNRLGLPPFSYQDTLFVLGQLEDRHEIELSEEQCDFIFAYSGGHPGIIQAIIRLYQKYSKVFIQETPSIEWFGKKEVIQEECRKIWISLLEEERQGLLAFAHDNLSVRSVETGRLLVEKGLLKPSKTKKMKVFSPLFAYYIENQRTNIK